MSALRGANLMAIMAAAFGSADKIGTVATCPLSERQKQWDLPRLCLHCARKHTHNNAFCSPKCCKEFKP
jgi:hypothetical protein